MLTQELLDTSKETETDKPNGEASSNSFFEIAAPLAKQGIPVIRLRPSTKVAMDPAWPSLATTDLETIRGWDHKSPTANVGCVAKPDGCWYLDIDCIAAKARIERDTGHSLDGITRAVETLKAWHYYFLQDAASRELGNASEADVNQKELWSARVEKRYVVGPGSFVKQDGVSKVYVTVDKRPIVAAPNWLIEYLKNHRTGRTGTLRVMSALKPASPISLVVAHGGRNKTLTSLAGSMRNRGMMVDEMLPAVLAANKNRCDPPLDEFEVRQIAESVSRYAPSVPIKSIEPIGADGSDAQLEADYHHTDLGNALAFVERHGKDLRYCHGVESWYIWNGQRFEKDADGKIERLAHEFVRLLSLKAVEETDKDRRDALVKHAMKSEYAPRFAGMLTLARVQQSVAVTEKAFDSDPWLLNCQNGVLDLRTGTVLPHDRKYLMTKITNTVYDPSATNEEWERFLQDTFQNNQDNIQFIQRVAGYSLTGDTREEKLVMAIGPAATGKSTFLETIKNMLGDYAAVANFESFLVKDNAGLARPDIARLAGARFVISVEVDHGRKLATALLKQLTGGDTVTARFLYQREFEFRPTVKLWFGCNDHPQVRSTDSGSWRRIVKVPFEAVVPEEKQNKLLKQSLGHSALPAVLAWAVEGCLGWQKNGLMIPETIKGATEAYRESQDGLREFFEMECVWDAKAETAFKSLYDAYIRWCNENNEQYPIGKRKFTEELQARGCLPLTRVDGVKRRDWRGIRLESDSQEQVSGQGASELPF